MQTIEFKLSEQTATKLQEAAEKLGVTVADLLEASVNEKLARLDEDFLAAAEYVLAKNKKLYERLA